MGSRSAAATESNSGAWSLTVSLRRRLDKIPIGLGIDSQQLAVEHPERRIRRCRLVALARDRETRQLGVTAPQLLYKPALSAPVVADDLDYLALTAL